MTHLVVAARLQVIHWGRGQGVDDDELPVKHSIYLDIVSTYAGADVHRQAVY